MKKKLKAQRRLTASRRTLLLKASTNSTESPSKWIRIDRPFQLPSYVKETLDRLDDMGHIAYIVGGSVRDFILGRPTKDHDIATSANPDELCKLFPNAITVGKAFGVLKVPIEGSSYPLEIATFREDLEYQDHRRPTGVLFSDAAGDARRRDFTINALFYDFKSSKILDTVGGIEDLKSKVIRAIGDPHLRFREDALRLLRAVRFATTLDFTLEANTAVAIQARANLISEVSAERVRDELNLMLTGPNPAQAFKMMSELKLLARILPEGERLKGVEQSSEHHPEGDVWRHTLKCLECLVRQNSERSITLAWGMLLHDIGKPLAAHRSGGKNFNGHERDGAVISHAICERFRFSREETETIVSLVLDHLKFKDAFQMREATLQRFIRQPYFEELLALHKADASASNGNLTHYEFCSSLFQEYKRAPRETVEKLINGNDLIQLGLQPGPQFSKILKAVEDLVLEKKLKTKEEALEYVVKHFV